MISGDSALVYIVVDIAKSFASLKQGKYTVGKIFD